MNQAQSDSLNMPGKFLDSVIESNMNKNPLSDNSLMLKVRDGDLQKLGLLFERYNKLLFSYFYNLSRDQVVAEDLVQMVFIRVIKYKHTFKGEGSFKTWLFHIARNIHVDNWRKESRLGYRVATQGFEEQLVDEQGAGARIEENLAILEIAMSRLSEEKRELLVLSKLKGIRYREIAEMLDLSESNVKIRVFRALRELKEKYDEIEKSASYE